MDWRAQLSLLGGAVPASKENTLGGVMSDEEEEGVVCNEGSRNSKGTLSDHDSSGSSSLSSLLIYLHESLVDNFWQDQVVCWRQACRQGRETAF